MKLNIISKLLISIFLLILLTSIISINTVKAFSLTEASQSAKNFLNRGQSKVEAGALNSTSQAFYKVLLAIGIVAAIVVGMIIGIKLMIASADEKAKVKDMLMPYIAGCVVVFGAFGIWSIFVDTGNKMEGVVKDTAGTDYVKDVEIADYEIKSGTAKYVEPSFSYHGSNPKVRYTVVSGRMHVSLSQDENSSAVTIKGLEPGVARIKATFSDGGKELESKEFTVRITN